MSEVTVALFQDGMISVADHKRMMKALEAIYQKNIAELKEIIRRQKIDLEMAEVDKIALVAIIHGYQHEIDKLLNRLGEYE